MRIIERLSSRSAWRPDPSPQGDRLRVIVAGSVGSVGARLGTSGFDVVAVAETEDDLIHAVSAREPDAVVVEADLCQSVERVADLAPDAVIIAVGDRTPAGAVGRIQRGVSGTVMAGLLHALVAEGAEAGVAFGFLPAVLQPATPGIAPHAAGSLVWAKTELFRVVENILAGQPALLAAAGTAAVTVSASLLLIAGPSRDERPTSAVHKHAVERALRDQVVAPSPAARTPAPEGHTEGSAGSSRHPPGLGHRGPRHHPSSNNPSPPDHAMSQRSASPSRPPAAPSDFDRQSPAPADHDIPQAAAGRQPSSLPSPQADQSHSGEQGG